MEYPQTRHNNFFLGSITGYLPMGNGMGAIGYRGIWLWQLVIY
jgi:hypothetical protein